MTATIEIDLGGGVVTGNGFAVQLQNCVLALTVQGGVSIAISSGITNISVTPGAVSIAATAGAQTKGTLGLAISWSSGMTPLVTLDNLVPSAAGNPATISWPAAQGTETQILTPGDPMPLSGIVAD